jgi:cell division protein FtsZ
VNITGGADLTLGEVHQINEIIHDAVGDDAEIIFGAVHEPAMQGEIRVTVIATGFDRPMGGGSAATIQDPPPLPVKGAPVLPFPTPRVQRGGGSVGRIVPAGDGIARRNTFPAVPPAVPREAPSQDLSDMEIPTFIRRQMD